MEGWPPGFSTSTFQGTISFLPVTCIERSILSDQAQRITQMNHFLLTQTD
jgi:hypothetical protein